MTGQEFDSVYPLQFYFSLFPYPTPTPKKSPFQCDSGCPALALIFSIIPIFLPVPSAESKCDAVEGILLRPGH